MNPLNDPMILYVRAWIGVRLDRMRDEEGRSVGASAIEWAIITGLLALVAVVAYGIIKGAVEKAAKNAETQTQVKG